MPCQREKKPKCICPVYTTDLLRIGMSFEENRKLNSRLVVNKDCPAKKHGPKWLTN